MPFINQIHTDKILSNVAVKYQNQEYKASEVFPFVPVQKESDLYRTYNRDFRVPNTLRANKGLANEYSFEVSTSGYVLNRHALKDYVSDEDVQNYDIFDLKSDTVEKLTDVIQKRLEIDTAALFVKAQWSLNVSLSVAQQFNNTTTANPIPIFDTAATSVIQNSGYKPNFGICSRTAFVAMKNNGNVLDRTKYTSAEMDANILAGLFGLPSLLVASASYDSTAYGLTDSISEIWPDMAFVGYKPANPSPVLPSSGYIFKRDMPAVRRWRVEERQAEAIEVQMQFVPKVVASLTGYLIADCSA